MCPSGNRNSHVDLGHSELYHKFSRKRLSTVTQESIVTPICTVDESSTHSPSRGFKSFATRYQDDRRSFTVKKKYVEFSWSTGYDKRTVCKKLNDARINGDFFSFFVFTAEIFLDKFFWYQVFFKPRFK